MAGAPLEELANPHLTPLFTETGTMCEESSPLLLTTDDNLLNNSPVNNNYLQEDCVSHKHVGTGSSVSTDYISISTNEYDNEASQYKLPNVPNPRDENHDGLLNLHLVTPPQIHPRSLTRIAIVKRNNLELLNSTRTAVSGILNSAHDIMANQQFDAHSDEMTVEDSIINGNDNEEASIQLRGTNNEKEFNASYGYGEDTSIPIIKDTKFSDDHNPLYPIWNEGPVPAPAPSYSGSEEDMLLAFGKRQNVQLKNLTNDADLQEMELKLLEFQKLQISALLQSPSSSHRRVLLSSNKSTGVHLPVSCSVTSLESSEHFKLPKVPNPRFDNQLGSENLTVQPLERNAGSLACIITYSQNMAGEERKDAFCNSNHGLELELPQPQPLLLSLPVSKTISTSLLPDTLDSSHLLTRESSSFSVTRENRLHTVSPVVMADSDFRSSKIDDNVHDIAQGEDSPSGSDITNCNNCNVSEVSDASSIDKLVDDHDTERKIVLAFGSSRQDEDEAIINAQYSAFKHEEPKISLPKPPGWIIDPQVINDALTESHATLNSEKPSFIQSIFNCFGKKIRTKKSKVDPSCGVTPRTSAPVPIPIPATASTNPTLTLNSKRPTQDKVKDKNTSKFKSFSLTRKKTRHHHH